jgi:hypothetical protein
MRSIRTTVRERATRRPRLTNGLRRITRPARKLNAEEIKMHERRLRAEGRLGDDLKCRRV